MLFLNFVRPYEWDNDMFEEQMVFHNQNPCHTQVDLHCLPIAII